MSSRNRYDINITAGITFAKDTYRGLNKNFKRVYGDMGKTVKAFQKTQKKMQADLKSPPFKGWALSIMFAGMAVQNAMRQIWTSSTKTFNDVKHSTEGTVTGFDMLEGSLKYLGFTVGEVLEPLAMALIPIIDYVQQLIMNNPDESRGIFKLLTIFGTASAAGGFLVLAASGFRELLGIVQALTTINVSKWFAGLSGLDKVGSIVSVGFVLDAITDAAVGDWWGASASAFQAAGLMAAVGGKKTVGAALLIAGIALDFIGTLVDGKPMSRESLAGLLTKGATGFMWINPGVGAALLSVGIIAQLMGDDKWYAFVADLGVAFGMMFGNLVGLIEVILAPISLIINGLIKAYNMIRGKNLATIDITGWSDTVDARIQELQNTADSFRGKSVNTEQEVLNKITSGYNPWTNPNQNPQAVNNYYTINIDKVTSLEQLLSQIKSQAVK